MKIDVIVPTFQPNEKLNKLIRAIEKQTVQVNHIILVHSCNEESDLDRIKREYTTGYQNIKVYPVKKEDFNHGKTRNYGASLSDADICIFMTQDAIPKNAYLVEKLLEALRDEQVACAYARQLPSLDSSKVEKLTREFNYPDQDIIKSKKDLNSLGIKTFFCSNVCCAYNMKIFRKTGGFVNRTIFNEDMIYAGKIIEYGYSIAYVSKASVIHSHNYTAMQQLRRNFDLGVSQVEYAELFSKVSSEKEGLKMIVKIIKMLFRSGKYAEVIPYIYQSVCKYTGYQLGKKYHILPKFLINYLTMSPGYFK